MDGDVLMFAQVMTVIVTSTASFVAIGLGARVLWRWGSRRERPGREPHGDERMQRLETAVDTIAIEVERISEAQRFMVGLLSESLPARRAERAERAELPAPERSGRVITPH
jgi:hypothetical protein